MDEIKVTEHYTNQPPVTYTVTNLDYAMYCATLWLASNSYSKFAVVVTPGYTYTITRS